MSQSYSKQSWRCHECGAVPPFFPAAFPPVLQGPTTGGTSLLGSTTTKILPTYHHQSTMFIQLTLFLKISEHFDGMSLRRAAEYVNDELCTRITKRL